MMSQTVLKGLDFADAYIVDVEVDTPTSFPQHLSELRQVLHRLREAKVNTTFKMQDCNVNGRFRRSPRWWR